MFWHDRRPLLSCAVLHRLPGRLRIGCRALGYLAEHQKAIGEQLAETIPGSTVRVSSITANVLVRFDADTVSDEEVIERLESVLGAYALTAYKAHRLEVNRPTVIERRLQGEPLTEMLVRVSTTTAALFFVWMKREASPVSGGYLRRLLTIPALTSLSLAWPIFKSGASSLRASSRPNADTLSSTAILASILAGRDVSALAIIWLADIAELLTAYSMDRARRAIREMLAVGQDTAWRIGEDGSEERVGIEAVKVGDLIMVPTGDKIVVDGIVVSGAAAVDQASITGEFMPMSKRAGDQVFAGTVVKTGRLVIRTEKIGDDTTVARIVHLVEEATHRKAAIQNIADRTSAQFIPLNFGLAGVVYFLTRKTHRALNMLIIDYSCGVRLSTATALAAAVSTAARNGILIKGGDYLERLAEADTLIFDKTGTMTEGRPRITSILSLDSQIDEKNLLRLAAAAEEASTHPMAVAVIEHVRRAGWRVPRHSNTQVHAGRGVEAIVQGASIRVGNRRFMQDLGIELTAAEENSHRLTRKGESIVYVARDQHLLGLLGIQDALRDNMKKALNRLRMTGVDDIVLLTGDVEQHAEIVATRMAMDRFHAEVFPDDKAETVLKLQSRGARVVMVGDGINDAPALAYADIGIAMGGTRTDVAVEAADITITNENPLMIPATVRFAQKTMKTIRQNFAVAIGVNTVGLVLAAIGVLPVFWAAVLHNSCTVAVVLNSSRLLLHNMERE